MNLSLTVDTFSLIKIDLIISSDFFFNFFCYNLDSWSCSNDSLTRSKCKVVKRGFFILPGTTITFKIVTQKLILILNVWPMAQVYY